METATKSITCKLTTPELQKRKATVIAELKAVVVNRQELDNGFSYAFDGKNEIPEGAKEFLQTEIDL